MCLSRSRVSGWLELTGPLILVLFLCATSVVIGDNRIAGDTSITLEVTPTVLNGEAIQLAINWVVDKEATEGGEEQRKVDLTVITERETQTCRRISCSVLGIDAEWGSYSVPEEIHYMEEPRQCEFFPGCNYTVIFKYEHDPRDFFQKQITIPDCVENICRCEYPEKFPNFTIQMEYEKGPDVLHFRWNIEESSELIEFELWKFVVRYYKVHNTRNSHWSIEPHSIFLNESMTGDPWNGFADLPLTTTSSGNGDEEVVQIKAEVFLFDSKDCSSSVRIAYLELGDKEDRSIQESHWIPSSILIVLVALSFVIASVVVYKKSKLGRHIVAKLFRWPIHYSSINIADNSMTQSPFPLQSFPLQENRIYVEKELYDAKLAGKVDGYEVSPSCLSIGPEIGKGAFGRVFIALAHNADGLGNTVTVAVKSLRKRHTEEEAEEFFNEIETMKRVGYHENIICLLGCCTLRQPALMIMEYIGCGDLHRYLERLGEQQFGYKNCGSSSQIKADKSTAIGNDDEDEDDGSESEYSTDSDASYILQNEKQLRPSVTDMSSVGGAGDSDNKEEQQLQQPPHVLNHEELQQFAIQIANGMSHLEDLGITHRDLATRNILIDDRKRLKISDFGLSRNGIYVTTRSKKVPLRWLSIEAIRRSLYSSKSDVWAFGVVLWEIGTLGKFPYEGMDNTALLSFLMSGGRLKKPENCSEKLYGVMQRCWAENPLERPAFADLIRVLQEPEQKIYIDLDELGDNDDVFFTTTPVVGLEGRGRGSGEPKE